MPTEIPLPPGIHERCVDVDGVATHYLEGGAEGPPLLLLHGNTGDAFDWIAVLGSLAANRRVLALDLPGYGRTPPLEDVSPQGFARFALAFAAAVELDRFDVVGHSLGGMMAVLMARAAPDRLRSMVLVCSGGLGRATNPIQILLGRPGVRRVALAAGLLPGGALVSTVVGALYAARQPWRIPALWYREHLERSRIPQFAATSLAVIGNITTLLGQRYDFRPELSHLRLPTLAVWGIGDPITPAWQARSARLVPGGSYRMLPAGHYPHLEDAGRFTAIVESFLQEPAAPPDGETPQHQPEAASATPGRAARSN
ncbi:alpha/beta fold hydrolase [Amycolatopsis sp. NPDC049688]|uniref:alpha/beta fold hydrolase n=1 Tax=Amycolatopsis sp. NPDC049688 TaxID=3154733 RepID=UPI00343B391A